MSKITFTGIVFQKLMIKLLTFRYQEQTATVSQQTNRREAKMDASGQNKSYDIRVENFDISFGERFVGPFFVGVVTTKT